MDRWSDLSKICRSIAEIGQEPLQNTPTVGVLDKKQLEAAMKAQVANQSAKMEKLNQVLLKSMTKMELKIEEQKKELNKAQKEFEVRLTQKDDFHFRWLKIQHY